METGVPTHPAAHFLCRAKEVQNAKDLFLRDHVVLADIERGGHRFKLFRLVSGKESKSNTDTDGFANDLADRNTVTDAVFSRRSKEAVSVAFSDRGTCADHFADDASVTYYLWHNAS